jgi:hypothetical protein
MLPEPDIILPGRFFPRAIATPETRLLLAVLEEAIGTFQRYAVATDPRSRSIFIDVEAWFNSEETTWLYSFMGICDTLGIDATYVRSGLGRWLGTQRTPSRETSQPLYRFPFRRVNGTRCRTNGRAEGMSRRA